MTENESGIIKDAYRFLQQYGDPPPLRSAASAAFWEKAAAELQEAVAVKWKHHPLAMEVFPAVYNYIEIRQKAGKGAKQC